MEEMRDFLRLADLSQYAVVFEDMGYDSVNHLLRMSHKELMDLRQITNMKHGHFARLLSSVEEARAPATASEASYPSTSVSSNLEGDSPSDLAQLGPIEVGPRVIVAPRDGVAQSGAAQLGVAQISFE